MDSVLIEQEVKKIDELYELIREHRRKLATLKIGEIKEKYLGKFVKITSIHEDEETSVNEGEYMFITNIWYSNSRGEEEKLYIEGYGFTASFYDFRDCTEFYWSPFIQKPYTLDSFLNENTGEKYMVIDEDEYMDAFYYFTNSMIDRNHDDNFQKYVECEKEK